MKNMKYDIVALGELLVDFSQRSINQKGNPIMEVSPGGAPCNLLSMATKLGSKCAFIGKVGNDYFGSKLREGLIQQGIECKGLILDDKASTTLAFVHEDSDGKHYFSFSRKPGADTMLRPEEVETELIKEASIFHFGSVSFSNSPSREATEFAIQIAEKAGCLLTFDANIRHNMWDDDTLLMKYVQYGLAHCQVLKVSDEELKEMYPNLDMKQAVQRMKEEYSGIDLILVTCGVEGNHAFGRDFAANVPAIPALQVADTTGAGDSFFGSCVHFLADKPEGRFEKQYVEKAMRYGSSAASIIVSREGSLFEMPTKKEVEKNLNGIELSK